MENRGKINLAIGVLWLFHLSAIIGISTGNLEWFITKTPWNLSICLLIFALLYPLNSNEKIIGFVFCFTTGMGTEMLGVNYGILFGDYSYGPNMGLKWLGVPWLIGCFWALLAFTSYEISAYFTQKKTQRVLLAASLMLLLDLLMEKNAPTFGFWSFEPEVPLYNYICWGLIALLMVGFLSRLNINGNRKISLHLFLTQLLFFAWFFVINPY